MTTTSHQIVFTGPGEMAIQERILPDLGPDEIRIRTRKTLISPGTERAFFLGMPNTTQTYPQFTGYNNIGEIVAVGQHVTGLAPGTRVASPAHHASFVHSPATETYPVPDGLDDESASFFNLVSIALQGIRKARIEIGESVAVIGAGLIGILAGQLAQLSGALPVTVIDYDVSRLEFARTIGLGAALAQSDQSEESIDSGDLPSGDLAPTVVVEATGHPAAVNAAFDLAIPGARVVLLGSTRGVTGKVNFYRDVHRKGLHIIGAHDIARPVQESYPGYWTQSDDRMTALRLMAAGRLQIAPLITHRISWRDATSAYDVLRSWDASALGIILNWQE